METWVKYVPYIFDQAFHVEEEDTIVAELEAEKIISHMQRH
jgi:hypothetical protein